MKKLSEEEKQFIKVNEIVPNIREIYLVAKVIDMEEERTVTSRKTNEEHRVMDVLVGDETGVLYYSAWNEQIDMMKKDETFKFLNAKTILYKRNLRLSLGKQGTIEDSEEKIEEVNTENNISLAEHDIPRRNNYRSY